MRKSIDREGKPFIIISTADQLRLTDVAMSALNQAPEVAQELLSEIERATVVPTHAVPTNVVQMGSTVEFTTEEGASRRVTLVFPGQADIAAARISVVTPIGAALIGLSEGQSIVWMTRDGRERRLTVLAVEPPAPRSDTVLSSADTVRACL
jgi:regulator of nucleoside diphosphate kinase